MSAAGIVPGTGETARARATLSEQRSANAPHCFAARTTASTNENALATTRGGKLPGSNGFGGLSATLSLARLPMFQLPDGAFAFAASSSSLAMLSLIHASIAWLSRAYQASLPSGASGDAA